MKFEVPYQDIKVDTYGLQTCTDVKMDGDGLDMDALIKSREVTSTKTETDTVTSRQISQMREEASEL